jgi:hypothetical protein
MKYALSTLFMVGAALLAGGIVLHGRNFQANSTPPSERTPVIVELFTSEGCSSCPPADVLLKKFEESQPVGSAEVFALEEHVDYWNSQGWNDPFSSLQFTLRQQQYSASLRTESPYTPQMIVDGQAQFIGSRGGEAQHAIEAAGHAPKIKIEIVPKNADAGRAQEFTIRVGKLLGTSSGDSAEVWLAITESQLHSSVTAGENKGENLQHASIVRRLQKIGDAKGSGEFSYSGNATAKFDSNWKRENTRVIVFVQEKKSRHILAAGSPEISR